MDAEFRFRKPRSKSTLGHFFLKIHTYKYQSFILFFLKHKITNNIWKTIFMYLLSEILQIFNRKKIYPTNNRLSINYHITFVMIILRVRCTIRCHREIKDCLIETIGRILFWTSPILVNINNVQIVIPPGINERICR